MRERDIAIVVLTNDIEKRDGQWISDDLALMRVDAAALLYYQLRDQNPLVIVSGGKIHGPDKPSLAEIDLSVLVRDHHIDRRNIVLEEMAIDTSGNAKYSLQIAHANEIPEVLVVTHDFHLPRADYCFRKYNQRFNLKVKGREAEQIMLVQSYRLLDDLYHFKHHPSIQRRYEREAKLLRIYQTVPFGMEVATLYVHVQMLANGGSRVSIPQEHVYTFRHKVLEARQGNT